MHTPHFCIVRGPHIVYDVDTNLSMHTKATVRTRNHARVSSTTSLAVLFMAFLSRQTATMNVES